MEWELSLLGLKTLVTAGLALWLTLAVANNITDPRTNTHLLTQMMSMAELKQDGVLGQGLLWRAVTSPWLPRLTLRVVIVLQLAIVLLLWRAAWLLAFGSQPAPGIAAARLAFAAFGSLWLFFLCGGMWFGYWIKMPQVQQVHLTLLLIAIGAMALVSL